MLKYHNAPATFVAIKSDRLAHSRPGYGGFPGYVTIRPTCWCHSRFGQTVTVRMDLVQVGA